jgi:hypothetical protein
MTKPHIKMLKFYYRIILRLMNHYCKNVISKSPDDDDVTNTEIS